MKLPQRPKKKTSEVTLEQALMLAFGVSGILYILALFAAQLGAVHIGDLPIYSYYALKMSQGQLPYITIHLEYLPGVIPFLATMMPLGIFLNSVVMGFVIQAIAALSLVGAHIRLRYGKRLALTTAILLLPMLQFVFYEFDIFSAATLYAAVYLIKQRRYSYSALFLAFSTLIKLYPGVCLLGLIWVIPAKQRRRYLAVFFGSLAAILVPLALITPQGFAYAIGYHTGRPLEFESSGAVVGFLLHLFGEPLRIMLSHMSWAVIFPGQSIINALTTALLGAGLLAISWLTYKKRLQPQPATLSMILLLIFVLFFKVGSPQYLVPALLLFPMVSRELTATASSALAKRLFLAGMVIWLQFLLLMNTLLITQNLLQSFVPVAAALSALRIIVLAELILFLVRSVQQKPLLRS